MTTMRSRSGGMLWSEPINTITSAGWDRKPFSRYRSCHQPENDSNPSNSPDHSCREAALTLRDRFAQKLAQKNYYEVSLRCKKMGPGPHGSIFLLRTTLKLVPYCA